MAFTVVRMAILTSIDMQGLSPAALEHEKHPDFKRAFEDEIADALEHDTLARWGNLLADPITIDPATGSADPPTVHAYLVAKVHAEQGGSGPLTPMDSVFNSGCHNTPAGWERDRTFRLWIQEGDEDDPLSGWTLTKVVDRYKGTYKKTISWKHAEDELRGAHILLTVRWTAA